MPDHVTERGRNGVRSEISGLPISEQGELFRKAFTVGLKIDLATKTELRLQPSVASSDSLQNHVRLAPVYTPTV